MSVEQMRARRTEITKRQNELLGAVGYEMNADEAKEFDDLQVEFDGLGEKITEAEAIRKANDDRRKSVAGRKPDALPRRSQPVDPGSGRVNDDAGESVRVIAPEKFRSLGEQLQAIAGVALSGREDNRLHWEPLTPHAVVSGAGAGVPSDGGYLIQQDIVTSLMAKMYATGDILPRVTTFDIGPNSDGLKMNLIDESSRAAGSRWGGVQVYWGAEADAATAKKPKFRQASWELKDLIGLAYITDRLLADAPALESIFGQAFSSEMSFMMEDGIINGTGAGQMLGILSAGCVVSVAKETGQPVATIVSENILKMYSRMWAPSRRNAIWIINQDCEPQLFGMTLGSEGKVVYQPPGGLSQLPYATLMGYPVIPTEYNATLGTTGDIMLIDPTQYVVIRKGGLQADSSIHVRFANNERTFRFIYRTDGQPTWNTTLTPAKGTATKSPFIKLDTRA